MRVTRFGAFDTSPASVHNYPAQLRRGPGYFVVNLKRQPTFVFGGRARGRTAGRRRGRRRRPPPDVGRRVLNLFNRVNRKRPWAISARRSSGSHGHAGGFAGRSAGALAAATVALTRSCASSSDFKQQTSEPMNTFPHARELLPSSPPPPPCRNHSPACSANGRAGAGNTNPPSRLRARVRRRP